MEFTRLHRSIYGAAAVVAGAQLAGCTSSTVATTATSDDLTLASGNGITVTDARWITGRTLEADISTAFVDPSTINGPHRIRITIPNDYDQNPNVRYPVLYLLHGGAGGNSAQWTSGGGAAEDISDGHPVIVVMPDGGKVGWFTDWVDQSAGAQRWAGFYIDQVIPWIDGNLRTVAAKTGRAIAGLSMGGYGAVRLAQDRPDLFGAVASFSGAVDLGDLGTRIVITEQSVQNGLPAFGAFGSPFWPSDTTWRVEDPMLRATALAGVQVSLYAGGGTSDVDVLERTMGQSADRFSHVLDANGIGHLWWMYGIPGPQSPFGCDGGHDFTGWNFALNDALPRMLSVLQRPPVAPNTDVSANGGFEIGLASWGCYGPCGVDGDNAFSHSGGGNGWVRGGDGWNDLHQIVDVVPNRTYTLTGWLRSTSDGYLGVRTDGGQVIGEQHFAALGGYTRLTVTVNSGANSTLVVYGGFWADGDTWLQLDDVSVVAG